MGAAGSRSGTEALVRKGCLGHPQHRGQCRRGSSVALTSLSTAMRASEYSMTCWGSAWRSSPGSVLSVRLYSQGVRSGGPSGDSPGGSGRVMARDLWAEVVDEQVAGPPPTPGQAPFHGHRLTC